MLVWTHSKSCMLTPLIVHSKSFQRHHCRAGPPGREQNSTTIEYAEEAKTILNSNHGWTVGATAVVDSRLQDVMDTYVRKSAVRAVK